MNLPAQFQLNQESLQELAEQLKPYLFNEEAEQKDFAYPLIINLKEFSEICGVKDSRTAVNLIKALKMYRSEIGEKGANEWMIDSRIVLECMECGLIIKALKKVREGKV